MDQCDGRAAFRSRRERDLHLGVGVNRVVGTPIHDQATGRIPRGDDAPLALGAVERTSYTRPPARSSTTTRWVLRSPSAREWDSSGHQDVISAVKIRNASSGDVVTWIERSIGSVLIVDLPPQPGRRPYP